jgi:hypothetical protein
MSGPDQRLIAGNCVRFVMFSGLERCGHTDLLLAEHVYRWTDGYGQLQSVQEQLSEVRASRAAVAKRVSV